MKVLVTGAAGMLGLKFCRKLAETGMIAGEQVESLTMADVIDPPFIADAPFKIRSVVSDLSELKAAEQLIAGRPDVILHSAAIVSGEAETDFDKGYRINLSGTQYLFDAVRRAAYMPRLIFASSIAVFGAPFPEVIG